MRDVKIGMKYKPMSEQGKANLSKALTGRIHSEETKQKMSIAHKGKRLGISTWNKGGKMSDKWKEKISKANKGRKFTEEHRRKLSKVTKANWDKKLKVI